MINGQQGYSLYDLPVSMPAGKDACKYCPCCQKDYNTGSRRCWMTGEFLDFYETGLGFRCPLTKVNK